MHGGGRPNDDLRELPGRMRFDGCRISSIGTKLAVDESEPVTSETDASITHALGHYAAAWKADFRPALGQVRLIASRQVAELADRVSSAITHTQSSIRERESLQEFDLVWGRTGMLVDVLRDAIRVQLCIEGGWGGVAGARRVARRDGGLPAR